MICSGFAGAVGMVMIGAAMSGESKICRSSERGAVRHQGWDVSDVLKLTTGASSTVASPTGSCGSLG